MTKPPVALKYNTALADDDCRWCGAEAGKDVHTPACPNGERYKQVQSLGGVAWQEMVRAFISKLWWELHNDQ